MRFRKTYGVVTAALLLSTTTAMAQTTTQPAVNGTPAIVPVAPGRVLSVSMPDHARLRLDLDARDGDVLGVVKSFLRGFKGESLQNILRSMGRTSVSGTNASDDKTDDKTAVTVDAQKTAAVQLLSDADLETILSNIDHVRFVVFETARPSAGTNGMSWRSNATKSSRSVISYYEDAYLTREGGRRIARGDFDDTQILAVGFPNRGFALVIGAPGTGVVIRADGYPNFEGLGPLLMGVGLLVAPQMR